MKRILCLTLALTALLCGCSKFPAAPWEEATLPIDGTGSVSSDLVPLPQGPVFDYTHYDWAATLLADAFTAGTPIGNAGLEKVQLQVESVTDSTVTLTITAPNIADSLWQWYAAQKPEEAALEAKILSLLSDTPPTTETFTLNYRVGSDGVPKADYTAAYGSAVSCGLTDFYHRLQREFLAELEGSIYG